MLIFLPYFISCIEKEEKSANILPIAPYPRLGNPNNYQKQKTEHFLKE